ncbi:oxidoreductase, partial [bacterium]
MGDFTALRIHRREGAAQGRLEVDARLERLTEADLSAGDVLVRVAWSGINYKDALAATGAGSIL